MAHRKEILLDLYRKLYDSFGRRGWWPADSAFEVTVGAVLTQNTAWRNVKKAIDNLKAQGLLRPVALRDLSGPELAQFIRPAGYYNLKARRLKALVDFFYDEAGGDLERLFSLDWPVLREKLLAVHGIGPETADSILLYAGNKPTFVVDAYTKRILCRHNLIPEESTYDEIRDFFMDCLPADAALFNDYHAQLVHLGHAFCLKRKPACTECPAGTWNRD